MSVVDCQLYDYCIKYLREIVYNLEENRKPCRIVITIKWYPTIGLYNFNLTSRQLIGLHLKSYLITLTIGDIGVKWEVLLHGCKMGSFYTFLEARLLSMIHHMD